MTKAIEKLELAILSDVFPYRHVVDLKLPGSLRNDDGSDQATPEINNLLGWMRKNNRAARAPRFLVQFFDVVYQMTTWIFIFEVLKTTQTGSCKSFILCLYVKTIRGIRAKRAKVHFTCFLQRGKHGIITKHSTKTQSSILMWRCRCSNRRSFLNSPIYAANHLDLPGNYSFLNPHLSIIP